MYNMSDFGKYSKIIGIYPDYGLNRRSKNGVMEGFSISFSYHAKVLARLGYPSPKADAAVGLDLSSNGIGNHLLVPQPLQVRATLENASEKVIRRFHGRFNYYYSALLSS